jgi:hypothetical protein
MSARLSRIVLVSSRFFQLGRRDALAGQAWRPSPYKLNEALERACYRAGVESANEHLARYMAADCVDTLLCRAHRRLADRGVAPSVRDHGAILSQLLTVTTGVP